jgi:pimeloyl-ACP methyl ester carboxylesterase
VIIDRLVARVGNVELAGSLWRPDQQPRGLVLMHPGSGPSDRDNDVLFPPIRTVLLDLGVAVCSFDKRGVGGSTGNWLTADIDTQAADLLAGLKAATAMLGGLPTGLLGHSQGGWVVLEAAASTAADFVITNSGPAVSPREQETYSTRQSLLARGWDEGSLSTGMMSFSMLMDLFALPFDVGWPRARALPLMAELIAADVFVPTDEQLWNFAAAIIDHDPRPALRALDVPLLALLGKEDTVVPVQRSAEVFRATVRADLLDLHIIPTGDHRLQNGDRFAEGYLRTMSEFVTAQWSNSP